MSDHQAGCHCTSSSTASSGDDLTENCESCGQATQDQVDVAPVLPAEDVPNFVDFRRRSGDHQATLLV